ncbi:hypothetical protein BBJ28_00014255 [Nothophytophthora sp. Chile5]|nr:hypothetical protein BBJ28_00014255 [Nothophytophthora sp. Chile5]
MCILYRSYLILSPSLGFEHIQRSKPIFRATSPSLTLPTLLRSSRPPPSTAHTATTHRGIMATVRRALEHMRLPSGLQSERVQWLFDGAVAPKAATAGSEGRYLLYWMQTAVRTRYNYALEFAMEAANELKLPLHVLYLFPDRSIAPPLPIDGDESPPVDEWLHEAQQDANAHAFATERHAQFALEGLADAHRRLAGRGLSLDVIHHHHVAEGPKATSLARAELLTRCAQHAALVVTDRPYLRPWRVALDTLVSSAEAEEDEEDATSSSFGIVQVEGDVVVPVAVASDKEEYAARTIRPKITRQLERYLVPLEVIVLESAYQTVGKSLLDVLTDSAELESLDMTTSEVIEHALSLLDVDRSVSSVSWRFRGGETQASACAKRFLTADKLARYATERNEPSLDAGSDLSLYLRFGHICVVRVALAANQLKQVSRAKEGLASFLEELIVRRELAVNLVAYNAEHYDSMRCLPNYATTTLEEHADDPREWLYSRQELEAAQTGDAFWNAAQRELASTGKMHGYMRMYWAKKLLEWTRSPAEGFHAALVLNNKYALDAPDANSYAGVAWSFGKHDQGWKERPIFGKVRYMNEAGLKRKFRMDAYVRKVQRLEAEATQGSHEEAELEQEESSRKRSETAEAESEVQADSSSASAKRRKTRQT